jgi:aminoglycoside phosphotransferase (APT) family kinase protein
MRRALAEWLRQAWDAEAVGIEAPVALTGGAIQENWRLAARVRGGPMTGSHDLVLRLDAPSQLPASHARAEEFRILGVVRDAGVRVPEPLAVCADPGILGRPFFVMRHVAGVADAQDLTARAPIPGLAGAFGAELARLHRIAPPQPSLAFLGTPPEDPARAHVAWLRGLLDGLPLRRPALEWGLNWLWRNAPEPVRSCLCHCDFRTGNILVEDDRLAAVLDWEFAGWSDPAQDLGWVCAPCWRFRRPDLEAGGIGTREELLAGYVAAGGSAPEPERLAYWQVMAGARWAVLALWQAERHRSGAETSLELALTGHLVPELELELLALTAEG